MVVNSLLGTVLDGRYSLESLVFENEYYQQFKALQVELNRYVSVKVISQTTPARLNAYRARVLQVSSLNHPNIASTLEFGFDEPNGVYFLVCEHPIGTLGLPKEPKIALSIAVGVLSALGEAHAKGIVHGGVSEAVIYSTQTPEGEATFVKLANFDDMQSQADSKSHADDVAAVANLLASLQGLDQELTEAIETIQRASTRDQIGAEQFKRIILAATDGGQICPACSATATSTQKFCSSCGVRMLSERPAMRAARGTAAPPRVGRVTTRIAIEATEKNFVGREKELATLLEFVNSNQTGTLLISGQAGAGKSRLVRQCQSQATGKVAVFSAGPDATGAKRPWLPIAGLCKQLLGISNTSSLESLRQALTQLGLPVRDALPLSDILELETPHTELELAVRKRECSSAVVRLLRSIKRRFDNSALVFVDLDLFDEPSRLIVEELAAFNAEEKLKLIVTAERRNAIPTTKSIELRGLDDAAATELLTKLCGVTLPTQELMNLTKGHPQKIEQIAGWLSMGNHLMTAPDSLVGILSARIEQLPVVPRRILQAASIHGCYASNNLISKTLNIESVPLVDDAIWEGLIEQQIDGVLILSPLIAKVAADTIPKRLRANFHRRAWAALSGHASSSVLAMHSEGAGQLQDAFSLYLEAGEEAANRFDDPGAAILLSNAMRVARRLVAQGDNDAPSLFIRAAIKLAFVFRFSGHPSLAHGVIDEANFFVETKQQRGEVARAKSGIYLARGHSSLAAKEAREAIEIARELNDNELLCAATIDLASALDRDGDATAATAELELAVTGIAAAGEPASMLWLLALRLSDRYYRRMETQRAIELAQIALAHAEKIESRRGVARSCELLASIFSTNDVEDRAKVYRDRAYRVFSELGDRRTMAKLMLGEAENVGRQGTLEIARQLAKEIGWQRGIKAR